MTQSSNIPPALVDRIRERAIVLRDEHQITLWKQTDRLFAGLLILQWLVGIGVALWISPRAWEGLESYPHPHVWSAIFLGGLIAACPVALAMVRPGEAMTRFVISAAQVLHSALLIHLSGGRIETHFHVFGSLAFLSFYRDWRVLVPATLIVAADHAIRGLYWPESAFGVAITSHWRWLEHAGWVVFEDVILIWSCLRGAREIALLAARQAELETINHRVEAEVARQTERLESVTQELVGTARRAGMAEIATGVLHNVGNVLNSVNVAATVAVRKVKESEIASVAKVSDMLQSHKDDLAGFLGADERGKHLLAFLQELGNCLDKEQSGLLDELQTVTTGLEHIKGIVGAQQQHAKSGSLREKIQPADLVEQAISMDFGSDTDPQFQVIRDFRVTTPIILEKHKVLQILINLLSNARKAISESSRPDGRINISIEAVERAEGHRVHFVVRDNGVGIRNEHLAKIFSHGFTTQASGHGFGLHSAANAAREMGGNLLAHSDGIGHGATFTLDLPLGGMTSAEQIVQARSQGVPCNQQ
ncbi:MAG TPA: ATP-binding protein [Humisphaera sp.]|jgi:signal transduction histidine kinase|nr:ATP-binding protein [Humisphaera sp.]